MKTISTIFVIGIFICLITSFERKLTSNSSEEYDNLYSTSEQTELSLVEDTNTENNF